ncbi:hypothetical protein F2Q70_00043679 [Brassica cretica]|uniref:Uncharacterized protein n=1 Tax=Brassica cretica TaxID=69181 RepID=A0A8S9KK86_BRACR|nr:hypothetical protein F2Q70_00043679 [Brassica cretica]
MPRVSASSSINPEASMRRRSNLTYFRQHLDLLLLKLILHPDQNSFVLLRECGSLVLGDLQFLLHFIDLGDPLLIFYLHRLLLGPEILDSQQAYERRTKRRFDVGGSSTAPPPPPVRDQDPWPREREDEPIPLFDHVEDTHKAAKSSACRNRAIEDTWDDYCGNRNSHCRFPFKLGN